MGFMLTSFLGGAAEGLTAKLKQDEKEAQAIANMQFTTLLNEYKNAKAKNEEIRNKLTTNVQFIKGYFPQLSEDHLFEAAKNPAFIDKLTQISKERDFDPNKTDPNALITLSRKATGLTADKQINDLLDNTIVAAPAEKIPEGLGMFERRSRAIAEQQFGRMASSLGTSADVLRGAAQYKMPTLESQAKIDLGVLAKPVGFEQRLADAKSALVDALSSGDNIKIQEANTNATRFKVAEDMFKTDLKKTEADIQTDLANKIVAATKQGDKKTEAALTTELRMRQELMKRPGEDKEKVTQANYIVIANKAYASAIENVLPPGSFTTVQQPDGTTTITPKDLVAYQKYREGQESGRKAVIAEFTDPNTGLPKSEMHKNAMISIGIQFNQEGKPVIGPAAPASAAPATSGSSAAPRAGTATAPAAAPTAAPALAPAPVAKPPAAPTKTATMADVNAYAAQKKMSPAQVKADLEKNGYKIVD